jgi:hypothetical protein
MGSLLCSLPIRRQSLVEVAATNSLTMAVRSALIIEARKVRHDHQHP